MAKSFFEIYNENSPDDEKLESYELPKGLNPNSIWRYDRNGNRTTEVFCPRCKSYYCGFYQQSQTKSQYSANLNPLKPFTYANRTDTTTILERYICNDCGKVFD